MKIITLDHIGLLHRRFPIKLAVKYFPKGAGLSTLVDTTFGDRIDRVLQFDYSMLEVQLLNNTAVRNNKLYKTELLNVYSKEGSASNMLAALNRDARDVKPRLYNLIDKQLKRISHLPKEKLVVCGLLEHNMDQRGAFNVATYIQRAGFTAVDNPMQRNYDKLPGIYYESHGNNKGKCDIISPDGVDLSDINFYGRYAFQGAADFLEKYWMLGDNLNFSGGKVFIPPRDRTVKLTEYEFKYRLQMMKAAPRPPSVVGYALLTDKQIWKPMAENYLSDDPREQFPCFITKERVNGFNILSLEGKKIGYMSHYGVIDTRQRYYLGSFKNKDTHFTLLEKNGGREWVLLESGKYKYKVNIFRRTGLDR